MSTPPASVNLMALEIRLSRIWRSRAGSPSTRSGKSPSTRTSSDRPLSAACRAISAAALRAVVAGERPRLQREFLRFELGEVEDVVDHPLQMFAGAGDDRHGVALLWRQVLIQQMIGQRDHTVERRADLMAHRGEEIAFHARGGAGLVARLAHVLGPSAHLGLHGEPAVHQPDDVAGQE